MHLHFNLSAWLPTCQIVWSPVLHSGHLGAWGFRFCYLYAVYLCQGGFLGTLRQRQPHLYNVPIAEWIAYSISSVCVRACVRACVCVCACVCLGRPKSCRAGGMRNIDRSGAKRDIYDLLRVWLETLVLYLSHGAYFQVIISFSKPRTRLKYVKIITGERGLFLFGRSMCSPIFYVCECVCVRARADKANKQVSVHDGGNAEAHSRRFGATLWVFGHFNEHALPSNFWWGDVGGSCRVPPLCWTRVDMCIYILCGILLPLGCRVIPVVFFCAARCVVGATTLRYSDGKG